MDDRPIAVFDSGIGGLPYLAAIRSLLPDEAFVYVADREGFPYGRKSRAEVAGLVLDRMARIVSRFRPALIVLACNTASQAALAKVRAAHPGIPVVGTVPAVKPAAQSSKTGTIAVLSTVRASVDPYLDELVARHAQGVKVLRIGAQELVEFVETRYLDATEEERLDACRAALTPLKSSEADRLVLACTHFLHVSEYLAQAAGPPVRTVDSREGVAKRVASLVVRRESPDISCRRPGRLYATGLSDSWGNLSRFADGYGLQFGGEL